MSTRSTPLISVVIPVRDRAHLVSDALDSVARQTWRPLEVIVVDDGSRDGTPEAVSRWADLATVPIPLRLIEQSHAGGNAARNRGIAGARGAFIAFLDSDDTWRPDKLEKQMAVFDARPEFGAVYCGVREVDAATGAVLADAPRAYPQGDLLDALLVRDVTAPTSTYTIRRRILQETGGFDPCLRARQDWDMWIRLAERAQIGAVPEALVDLRHHSGPRTISDPFRELEAHQAILRKYARPRLARGFPVRLAALASYHRRAGRVHLHHAGAPLLALRHYLLAVAIWPVEPDSYAALLGWFLPPGPRRWLHRAWNRAFGRTILSIRSH